MLGAKSNLMDNLSDPILHDAVIKNLNSINPLMYQITSYIKEFKGA